MFYKTFLYELLHFDDSIKIPVICKMDNSEIHDAVHLNTQVIDKRLQIMISIIREILSKKELDKIIWFSQEHFNKNGVLT